MFDYNTATNLIPEGTRAAMRLEIDPGMVGEDGILVRSSKGDCEMLKAKIKLLDTDFKGRTIWLNLVLQGTTAGHAQIAVRNRALLRAILESAMGIRPDDESDEARKKRAANLPDFDGIAFIGIVGTEKATDKYPAKNILLEVVTPDQSDWRPIEQAPPRDNGGGPSKSGALVMPNKPSWASPPASDEKSSTDLDDEIPF